VPYVKKKYQTSKEDKEKAVEILLNKIRFEMKKSYKTITNVAEESGVFRPNLSRILSGKRGMLEVTALRLEMWLAKQNNNRLKKAKLVEEVRRMKFKD